VAAIAEPPLNKKVITYTTGSAFAFVQILGVVKLFADMTFEGGAAINGQFLATLGASAAAVSIIAGVGEFLEYSLRSVAGALILAERIGRSIRKSTIEAMRFGFAGAAVHPGAIPVVGSRDYRTWWRGPTVSVGSQAGTLTHSDRQ
jgi:hypothetical protein